MKTYNTLASFRRRPESIDFNDILDSGLRRNDGNKVNGAALKSNEKTRQQPWIKTHSAPAAANRILQIAASPI